MGHGIKKGDPVEFTRDYRQHYATGDGEYGIAIEGERSDNSVTVELANGFIYLARYIHACSWVGWIPEDLEEVQYKHNSDENYDDYY
jgi:hypothetical protein